MGDFFLDDTFGKIKVLQMGEPLRIDGAQHFLSWIDQLVVITERLFDLAFLAVPLGDELTKWVTAVVGSSMMSLMPCSAALTKARTISGLVLMT